jgi:hypothetical protein
MRTPIKLTLAAALATLALAGCSSTTTEDSGTPETTVSVYFTIDDTANKVFTANDGGASDLEWKGAFKYAKATGKITADSTWGGPFPALYDDGPVSAGGHEPEGNTAGDHKWGIAVKVEPPATGTANYEYGAQDATTQGWLWRGTNGKFSVAAGATSAITATGLTLLAFGTNDLKLVIDTGALVARPNLPDGGTATWDLSTIKVKGSAWGWKEATAYDDGTHGDDTSGDSKYTFILSNAIGAGNLAPHSGLLASGDSAEFVWVFSGNEYKDANGQSSVGVTAFLKASGGSFASAAITEASNGNPAVVVP